MSTLPDFEGQTVYGSKVRITNAGDGLSEALKIEPVALALDDQVCYVLRGSVSQVNHTRKSDDDPLVRVHTIKASAITEIDSELADKLLAEAAAKLDRAKAAADGQLELGGDE